MNTNVETVKWASKGFTSISEYHVEAEAGRMLCGARVPKAPAMLDRYKRPPTCAKCCAALIMREGR